MSVDMEQYSFDEFGQIVPCPDREKCGAYLLSPLPDGTPRGCTGERKWCKMNFDKVKKTWLSNIGGNRF